MLFSLLLSLVFSLLLLLLLLLPFPVSTLQEVSIAVSNITATHGCEQQMWLRQMNDGQGDPRNSWESTDQVSINYQFFDDQTMRMYGDFDGFPFILP